MRTDSATDLFDFNNSETHVFYHSEALQVGHVACKYENYVCRGVRE